MNSIAFTPQPPYYAVVFTSVHRDENDGYAKMADRMAELAATQPGYLGMETAHTEVGITVSYWESMEAIAKWRGNAEHLEAQARGQSEWYKEFRIRVCKVEREYGAVL